MFRSRLIMSLAIAASPLAGAVDLNYTKEPQLADSLCWAAATQMIVDYFGHPHDEHGLLYDQARIATYARARPDDPENFQTWLAKCEASIAVCNISFMPILGQLGFEFQQSVTLPAARLTRNLITEEIDADRPIVFAWRYGREDMNSGHVLLIAGYHHNQSGKLLLHIYDPLPIGLGSAQIMRYADYARPSNVEPLDDSGLAAEHWFDYYQIHPGAAQPAALPSPWRFSPVDLSAGPPADAGAGPIAPAAPLMDLQQAIRDSQPYAKAEIARLGPSDYELPARAPFKLAAESPLPFVAVTVNSLRAADVKSVASLLLRGTNTVLYPLTLDGAVLDSLLMSRRGNVWKGGGYANNTVTRILVGFRQQRSHADTARSGFYVLAVPELGAFFLTQGSGAQATLTSVADDPSLQINGAPLRAGQALPADQVLQALRNAALQLPAATPVQSAIRNAVAVPL